MDGVSTAWFPLPVRLPPRGLRLEVLWFDIDVIELHVAASNGAFAGTTRLYVGRDGLKEAADRLRGFPRSPADERELVLGTLEPGFAGGGVLLRMHCTSPAGHAVVHVTCRSDTQGEEQAETAAFSMPVLAAGMDDFVRALDAMPVERGAAASLRCDE